MTGPEVSMFPLSRWHALWLAGGVFASAVAMVPAWRRHATPPAPVTITETSAPAAAALTTTQRVAPLPTALYVHVSGQVARPGLYRLAPGARVMDAVTGAGGATADADLNALNLATPLRDGQKLTVPGFGEPPPGETPDYLSEAPAYAPEPVLVRPDPAPIAPPAPDVYAASAFTPAGAGYSPAPRSSRPSSGRSAKLRHPGEGVVSINGAASAELQRLPGVGPSTAAKIADYRAAHGGFRTVDELMEVKGIGPKKLEKMRPFLSL